MSLMPLRGMPPYSRLKSRECGGIFFNQKINPSLKTIYFRAVDAAISSTMAKELFSRGKDVSEYVPAEIAAILGKEEL